MKGMKKTLAAGLFSCAAMTSVRAEISPWSYGAVAFGTNSSFVFANDGVKATDKEVSSKLLATPFFGGYLSGGYAFSDYLGVELKLGYLKQGGAFVEKEAAGGTTDPKATPKEYTMAIHGISVPVGLSIYPLGREEGEGLFKIFVGGHAYYGFKPTIKNVDVEVADKEMDDTNNKAEVPSSINFGAMVSLSYEWEAGVYVEGMYGMDFMNRFPGNKTDRKLMKLTDLESAKVQSMLLGVGYNFASLFKS